MVDVISQDSVFNNNLFDLYSLCKEEIPQAQSIFTYISQLS